MAETSAPPPPEKRKAAPKKDSADEVVFTKPTSQLDLEARLSAEAEVTAFHTTVNPTYVDEDGNGYVGTDAIYTNRANEVDQPLEAEEGADALAEGAFFAAVEDRHREPSKELKQNYKDATIGSPELNVRK